MDIKEEIRQYSNDIDATIVEKNGQLVIEKTLAERNVFLSHKKLIYRAKIRIDEEKKQIVFTEMLKETGFGLSSAGGDDISPGFGFKMGTYKTGFGGREGNIQEQSTLFGKKYQYTFDYGKIRKHIENLAKKHGYTFHYSIF